MRPARSVVLSVGNRPTASASPGRVLEQTLRPVKSDCIFTWSHLSPWHIKLESVTVEHKGQDRWLWIRLPESVSVSTILGHEAWGKYITNSELLYSSFGFLPHPMARGRG